MHLNENTQKKKKKKHVSATTTVLAVDTALCWQSSSVKMVTGGPKDCQVWWKSLRSGSRCFEG